MDETSRPIILIVDDTVANIRLLGSILGADYEIAIATNGAQALELAHQIMPTLILLDVMMPDMNGFEVCRRLQDDPQLRTIPIIFLTARTDEPDIVAGFDAGAVDYIAKPFIQKELLARVSVQVKMQALISELGKKNAILHEMAVTDELTKIANRRFILDRLKELIASAERYRTALSVVLVDIDQFKKINDTYGHQMGDTVLCRVASTIQSMIREADYAGRFGGEEFMVVFSHTDANGGFVVAEKIRAAVEAQKWEVENLRVTLSGGVATYEATDTLDNLIARADTMLYKAKEWGRNRICAVSETG
jgi:diguanylate cyclase (GGDEF)-like protein